MLQLQDIRIKGNATRTGLVFWDNGSTLCLIREAFAAELKLKGRRVCLWVQAAGHDPEKWETTVYKIKLLDKDDVECGITAFSVESITSEIELVFFGVPFSGWSSELISEDFNKFMSLATFS